MGGAMPSSDKVLVSSVLKAATRELPNKGAGIVNMSQGTSALPKDKGPTPTTDSGKVVVTKRQHSDTPSGPGYHNVYVRRKVESEHNKVNSSQELKGNGRDKTKEQEPPLQGVLHDEVSKPQQDEVNKPHSDEVSKPHNDEVSKPHNDEVSKPQHEKVSKPQHEEVSKPQHEEVSKPQNEEVSKLQHEEVSKLQYEEVSKPQHEEVSKLQHEEVSKPQNEEVSKLQHEEVSKPQNEEVSKLQHEEVSKPQNEEVSKLQHEKVRKPQNEEVSKLQHEKVSKPQNEEVSKPKVASPIAKSVEVELVPSSSEKTNVETVPEKTDPQAACGTGIEDDAEQSSIQYWSERFNRLQTYLENCNQSTQEGYLRKLRSLSATGRSMHAIELEKRAIHLLMEEGKELQRMKALNVGLPKCYIQANTIAATVPEIICRYKICRAKMVGEYVAGVLVTTHIAPVCPGAFFANLSPFNLARQERKWSANT